jgi:GNAT superfamily N-acetyltransferase
MDPGVRLASADDVEAVARALADAFDGDPWISWVVAADGHRHRLVALQSSLLELVGVPYGEVWLAEDGDGGVVGAALWLVAEREVPAKAWAEVAAAEGDLMGDRGMAAAAAAAATRHLRPATPHHLLASLGVVPSCRRRGTGSALLAPVLERADRNVVAAYLETSAEENLPFYAGHGFEVTGHLVVPGGGPPVWAMARRPRSI